MKKIKIYISITAMIAIVTIIIIKPQYIENATKALVAIMECEQCIAE
mgnify:CR=1 FL=1